MHLLVIDNYDSFTYNLVQYFGELNVTTDVIRNDAILVGEIDHKKYNGIVISPGPCDPDRAGISLSAIKKFSGIKPIFGVCLGHQCIGQAFGGKIVRAQQLMHGKTSLIKHNNTNLFHDLPNPLTATRYHSLLIEPDSFPDCLKVTAQTDKAEIMGIEHRTLPLWGVQFHPESLATEKGIMILKNFINLCY